MSLFVGRLPTHNFDERDLEDIFYKYGKILNCQLKKGSRFAFGFIEFEDPEDAYDAIRDTDGLDIDGTRIVVEKAKGTPKRHNDNGCYNCGEDGHWARDCKRSRRDYGRSSGYSSRRRDSYSRGRSYSRSRSPYDRRGRSYSRDRSPRRYSRSPSPRRYSRSRSPRRYSRSRSPRRYSRSRSPRRYSRSRSPRRYSRSRSPRRYSRSRSPQKKPLEQQPEPENKAPEQPQETQPSSEGN